MYAYVIYIQGYPVISVPIQDSEEERRKDHFVQDPAKIREAQAQRIATREAQRHRHRGQGQLQGQGPREYNVTGNPKGQGQSADVTRNRAWKERHKGSRVHHNRRTVADRKRQF